MTNLTERTIELRRLLGSSYEVEDFYPRFVVRGNMVKFLRVNFLGACPQRVSKCERALEVLLGQLKKSTQPEVSRWVIRVLDYCSEAQSSMARVSRRTRLRPTSRSLAEYHSACVWAPAPSPPAPMERAGTPSESGILASVEPRRRSVRRRRWRSTARRFSSKAESLGR